MVNIAGKTSSLVLLANNFVNTLPLTTTQQKSDFLSEKTPQYFPHFDEVGALMVKDCAINARDKERQIRQEILSTTTFPSTSASSTSMEGSKNLIARMAATDNSASKFLNGIPFTQTNYENPHRYGALFCRSGNWLHFPDPNNKSNSFVTNEIYGIKKAPTKFAIIEFIAVAFGLISMRSFVSKEYLCMNIDGRLYSATKEKYSQECVFMEEMLENYYNLYSSCAYNTSGRPWYVALRKSGKFKNGYLTRKRQKASQFLSIHFEVEDLNKRFEKINPYLINNAKATNNYQEHVKTLVDPKYFSTEKIPQSYSYSILNKKTRNDDDYEGPKDYFQSNNAITKHPQIPSQNSIDFDKWQLELDNFVSSSDDMKNSIAVEQPYRQISEGRFLDSKPFIPNWKRPVDTSYRHPESKYPHHNHRHHHKINHEWSNNQNSYKSVSSEDSSQIEQFRKDKKRKSRLEREEKRREERKKELERLRILSNRNDIKNNSQNSKEKFL